MPYVPSTTAPMGVVVQDQDTLIQHVEGIKYDALRWLTGLAFMNF